MKVLGLFAVTVLVAVSASLSKAENSFSMGYKKTYCLLSIPAGDSYWMSDVEVSDAAVSTVSVQQGAMSTLTKTGEEYKLFVRDTQGRSDEFTFKTRISATLTNTRIGVDCVVQ